MACNFVPSDAIAYISSRIFNVLRQRHYRAVLKRTSLSHTFSFLCIFAFIAGAKGNNTVRSNNYICWNVLYKRSLNTDVRSKQTALGHWKLKVKDQAQQTNK
jgi:hypothetical protein